MNKSNIILEVISLEDIKQADVVDGNIYVKFSNKAITQVLQGDKINTTILGLLNATFYKATMVVDPVAP